jgi:alpha-glucosidase
MSDYLWWRDGVIYQIYPRSFADANGDGLGDLPGIIAHLDYLRGSPGALGVDAIWLSPIYPSPAYDFGYGVADYEAVDPIFGTLADFDRLVTEAHRRGLRVVLDLVMNHTSHQHPWFIESRSSRDNPKRDWYIWQGAGPGGRPPNNWQSVFGGKGWEWDAATGQYYYHAFLKEQPDLNWRNPQVRARMFQVVRFWLDRGVDGFRLDVVNAFFKDGEFRDNPPSLGLRGYDRQQHVYDVDRPEMTSLLNSLRQLLDGYAERMAVGEVMGNDPALAARCWSWGTTRRSPSPPRQAAWS